MQRATDPKYDIRRNMRTYSLPHGNRGAMRNQPVAGAGKFFFSFFFTFFFSVCFLVRISSVVGQALKCVREHFVPTLHAMLSARIEVRWSLPYYRARLPTFRDRVRDSWLFSRQLRVSFFFSSRL